VRDFKLGGKRGFYNREEAPKSKPRQQIVCLLKQCWTDSSQQEKKRAHEKESIFNVYVDLEHWKALGLRNVLRLGTFVHNLDLALLQKTLVSRCLWMTAKTIHERTSPTACMHAGLYAHAHRHALCFARSLRNDWMRMIAKKIHKHTSPHACMRTGAHAHTNTGMCTFFRSLFSSSISLSHSLSYTDTQIHTQTHTRTHIHIYTHTRIHTLWTGDSKAPCYDRRNVFSLLRLTVFNMLSNRHGRTVMLPNSHTITKTSGWRHETVS